jgi:ankyrin repeat protein
MDTARKIAEAVNTPLTESVISCVRDQLEEALQFTPPTSFVNAIAPVAAIGLGLSVDYDLTFIDCIDEILSSILYSDCFQEFYCVTRMIPILNHGDGRHFDLYDSKTDSIIQFNVIDPPSEWIVLNGSFIDAVNNFHGVITQFASNGTPLPPSLYSSSNAQTLQQLFPDRAAELDGILPSPLVLRTHQAGTWQVDRIDEIHSRLQATDDSNWLHNHLASNPADMLKPTSKGSQPMHEAAGNGRIACLEVLVDAIVRSGGVALLQSALAARDVTGNTPLLRAASKLYTHHPGILTCVIKLIEKGADVCSQQDEGMTLLHFAAGCCCTDVVNMALQRGASVSATTYSQYGSRTPLHSLCSMRNYHFIGDLKACTSALVAAGADVNARDSSGSTPLHLVMWGSGMEDCSELVETLLEAGADPNATTAGPFSTSVLDSGFAREKYYALLSRFGTVDGGGRSTEGGTMRTAIFPLTAADFDTPPQPVLRTANALCGMSAQSTIQAAMMQGLVRSRTLLDCVRARDVPAVRAKLAEPDCDPNDANPDSVPPIVFAANAGAPEIIELLIAAGADVNAKDANGIGAIHGAQPDCLELLLQGGADPNMLDRYGQSALNQALDYLPPGDAKLEYCRLLLEYGAGLEVGRSGSSHLSPFEVINADPDLQELLDVVVVSRY